MRHRVWSALLGVSMLILLGCYIVAALGHARADAMGRIALLSLSGRAPAVPAFALAGGEARRAVEVDPLNQRMLNAAMVASVRARPAIPGAAWFAALSALGWRETTSRQNLLIHHAQANDLQAILDDVDGLLRRNQLIEQSTPLLLLVEADRQWQARLVDRLRGHPSWRFGYLQRGSLIDDPVQLAARARTLRWLQRSGDEVAVAEIAPVLPKLLDAGLGAEAFAIWRAREPAIARPVADPRFAALATETAASAVPFHWQLTNGPDHGIDLSSSPASHLTVSWNGVGAPVFASQTLSAPAGRYAVVLATPDPAGNTSGNGGGDATGDAAEMIGVRTICGTELVDFGPPRRVSPGRLMYLPPRPVPCAFARLELFGRRAPGATLRDRRAALSGVAITPA